MNNCASAGCARTATSPNTPLSGTVSVRCSPALNDTWRVTGFGGSGGAGGQNVNKVETAVRILHIPTGLFVRCTQERSQLQNKEKAMALLMAKLLVIAQEQRAAEIADIRGDIVEAAWGNQIRNYVFHPYQMVKDLRTQHETTDVQGVIDGDLDPFIQGLLHAGVDVAGGSSDD